MWLRAVPCMQLVPELPGIFRRGAGEAAVGFPDSQLSLYDQCTERIAALEEVALNLERPERLRRTACGQKATRKPAWQAFLEAVPDHGLDLCTVWAAAGDFADSDDEVRDLALLALWRRCVAAELSVRQRLQPLTLSSADVAVLRPALRGELQMLRRLLGAIHAGASGAAAQAARAQQGRAAAEAARSAAVAAAMGLRRAPEPPNSTEEGIQRWLQSVRQTGAVAANASDHHWKRQLEVLRAGLTGTAVCLGDPLATSPSKRLGSNECAICLELLRSADGIIPLPCGHSFHSACAPEPQMSLSDPSWTYLHMPSHSKP